MSWLALGISYSVLSVPMVLAVLLALGGWWGVISAASRVWVGTWLVGLAFLVETVFVAAPSLPLGINVNSNDLVFALLACSLVFRILFVQAPRLSLEYKLWLAFGTIIFASLAWGLIKHGSSAGVEARPTFYFWMAGLYFASFAYPDEVLAKLWRAVRWSAWLVAAVIVYRWVGLKYGFVSAHVVELAGASSEFRAVGSNQALFLGIVGVAYFAAWLDNGRRRALFGAVTMLAFAVVLQHRSVWVSTLAALAVVAWHKRSIVMGKAFQIVGLATLVLMLIGSVFVLSPSNRLAETLSRSVVSATESRGTHTDRIDGWKELLYEYTAYSPREWLLGKPFGTGYKRYLLGRWVEYAPHNFYVQLLLRLGAFGLALLLWIHFGLRRQLIAGQGNDTNCKNLHAVLLATMAASLLYYIPYQGFQLQGAVYGFLIGYFSNRLLKGERRAVTRMAWS